MKPIEYTKEIYALRYNFAGNCTIIVISFLYIVFFAFLSLCWTPYSLSLCHISFRLVCVSLKFQKNAVDFKTYDIKEYLWQKQIVQKTV